MMPWSVALMVVMIVLITAIAKVQREKYRAMRGDSQAMPADAIASREEVRQLKERIAVLERVITDNHGSTDLSRQIEELRDR